MATNLLQQADEEPINAWEQGPSPADQALQAAAEQAASEAAAKSSSGSTTSSSPNSEPAGQPTATDTANRGKPKAKGKAKGKPKGKGKANPNPNSEPAGKPTATDTRNRSKAKGKPAPNSEPAGKPTATDTANRAKAKPSAPAGKGGSPQASRPTQGRAVQPMPPGQSNTLRRDAGLKPDNPPKGKSKSKSELTPAELKEQKAQAKEQKLLNAEATALNTESSIIQKNPWTQAGNALAGAESADATQAESMMGAGPGSMTAAISGQAANQALADAGVTPGSAAGQWFQGELNQANANDSPLTNAMNAYASAYEKTEAPIISDQQAMGAANALASQVAPENDYLNLLPSHLGNTGYLSLTPAQQQGLPNGLEYYLGPKGAGVGGVGGGTATIPTTGATVSGGTAASNPPAVAPAVNPSAP